MYELADQQVVSVSLTIGEVTWCDLTSSAGYHSTTLY